jgi:PAS fold
VETTSEEFVLRASALTGTRMPAVAAAFVGLMRHSWPKPEVVRLVTLAERGKTTDAICVALLKALDAAWAEFPTAMFWWKNEQSEFLGFCPRFAAASGVPALELLGKTDADPSVAWNRQAALYLKDDREVLRSRSPRFDILERQDRNKATVWLRTSKVPYENDQGAGTVGGFDTISVDHARRLARARRSFGS